MKHQLFTLFTSLFCFVLIAQTNDETPSLSDFNFESVTNPAFTLLGETPTDINTPDNLKALALYLSNGFSNMNLALEVNPYWLIDFEEQRSYRSYRGLKTKDGKGYIDPFIGLKTNSSISVGYLNKEFEGFDDDKKTLSLGYRTTILQFYNKVRHDKINNIITRTQQGVTRPMNKLFQDFIDGSIDDPDIGTASCDAIDTDQELKSKYLSIAAGFLAREDVQAQLKALGREGVTEDMVVNEYIEEYCPIIKKFSGNRKTIKPVFRLDGAIGYSILFIEDNISSSTANRFGSWLTADFAVRFNDNSYLNIYAIGKYIQDEFNINEEGNYFEENFWDVGGKLEIELERFKFSYEYLNRSGFEDQYRSVGNIAFQINGNMSIVGGFGRDFPVDDNLVTLLGINWGLDMGESSFSK